MRKVKKCLAVVLAAVMMLGTASKIGYEPEAADATWIADLATNTMEIGKTYTVDCTTDLMYEYEFTGLFYDEATDSYYEDTERFRSCADAIYKVTVPSTGKLDVEAPANVFVKIFDEFGNDINMWNSVVNYATTEKSYIIALDGVSDGTTSEFTFTAKMSTIGPDFDGQVCVYSWNDELIDRMDYFYEKYPEYAGYVKCFNLNMSGTSDEYIAAIANLTNASSTTSIVAADSDIVRTVIESGNYEPLSSIGFDINRYESTAYDYTIARGSWAGELYSATWQICPSNFIYDVDIAQEVLGTSEPEAVQAMIDTPEKFIEVAAKMKSAGYTMCDDNEIYRYITTANVDKQQKEDATVKSFMDSLVSNGYTVGAPTWSAEWANAMTDKSVFGFFGCSWYTYWSYEYSDTKNVKTCQGPVDYAWGGSYLVANNKNQGNDVANLVLQTLCCDTDVMKSIMANENECVNNQTAIQQLIVEGKGSYDKFGGQNPYVVWDLAAKGIYSSESPKAEGIYVPKMDRTGVTAGMVTDGDKENAEYSWWACKDGTESWFLIQDWTKGNEWLNWTPDEFGDYIIVGKVRENGNAATETSSGLNVSYHPQIKGKCQMPYTGEGGGYLIGVESYENPNQGYQYEMLVLDCTLLLEGKDAWVYTTGKFSVTEGNAGWTVWQPQYGYYWTLFRVYDAEGNLLDQYCYSFANAY